MTAAAFQATYADWRVIKGRKVVQVCFELPLEAADTAYQVLGGMPIAAREVWCGIARLNEKTHDAGPESKAKAGDSADRDPAHLRDGNDDSNTRVALPRPSVVPASATGADNLDIPPELDRRTKSPAQIAGYLCSLPFFHAFLRERFPDEWHAAGERYADEVSDEDVAAECVRGMCNVQTRSQLTPNNIEWLSLMLAFKLWEREAEVVPA